MGTKADMMKQYYKTKTSLSQIMRISNEKYKILLGINKEDDVTKIVITNIENYADKSPCRFVTQHSKVIRKYFYKN